MAKKDETVAAVILLLSAFNLFWPWLYIISFPREIMAAHWNLYEARYDSKVGQYFWNFSLF